MNWDIFTPLYFAIGVVHAVWIIDTLFTATKTPEELPLWALWCISILMGAYVVYAWPLAWIGFTWGEVRGWIKERARA